MALPVHALRVFVFLILIYTFAFFALPVFSLSLSLARACVCSFLLVCFGGQERVRRADCARVACPIRGCRHDVPLKIIQQCLSAVEFEAYNTAAMTAYLAATDQSLVVCPNIACKGTYTHTHHR
jgi:hypothetical protein